MNSLASVGGAVIPLLAIPPTGGSPAAVGTYPSIVSRGEAEKSHFLQAEDSGAILLPDYLVEQDLPSAYQEVLRQQAPSSPGVRVERSGQ